jgi:hypothetical protein
VVVPGTFSAGWKLIISECRIVGLLSKASSIHLGLIDISSPFTGAPSPPLPWVMEMLCQ